MAKPHPPELKAKVLAEHAAAPHDTDDIAARHGVARSTLVKWVAAAKNPPAPKKKRTPNVLDKSPRQLKEKDGEWVYDNRGIARWHTHGGAT